MSNVSEFADGLNAVGVQVEAEMSARKRAVMQDFLYGAQRNNPVGQPALWKHAAPPGYVGGHSRDNWQVTNGSPAEDEVPGVRGFAASAAANDAALAEVNLDESGWVVNNAPYIFGPAGSRTLEGGYSTQAPPGWIEAQLERVEARYAAGAAGV